MTPIQIFLIISFIASLCVYFLKVRSQLLDRLVSALLVLSSVVFVFSPKLSTRIANFLGVGRGADLVFYVFIVTSIFVWILCHARLKRLDFVMTSLIRESALKNAYGPGRNSQSKN